MAAARQRWALFPGGIWEKGPPWVALTHGGPFIHNAGKIFKAAQLVVIAHAAAAEGGDGCRKIRVARPPPGRRRPRRKHHFLLKAVSLFSAAFDDFLIIEGAQKNKAGKAQENPKKGAVSKFSRAFLRQCSVHAASSVTAAQ